jgi:hypothetical protein
MRSFRRASTWLAAFVIGLPALGLVALLIALRGRSWTLLAGTYLLLFTLAYLTGLLLLAVLRFRPDWLRALVAGIAVYAIASITPLASPLTTYPYHVIRCGGLPIVATNFAAAKSYNTPDDEDYAVTPLHDTFFCQESDAKAAHYRHYGH